MSYLLCATPRSGSTLLCGLLRSSGVAGRPESWFLRTMLPVYADRWQVSRRHEDDATIGTGIDPDSGVDVNAYVHAVVRAGSTPNGVFGGRIMWGTMTELTDALAFADPDAGGPLDRLRNAFGEVRFLHLRREDVLAQAVSWARAQQSHYWHPGEDTVPGGADPHYDRDLIARLVDTIHDHEAGWRRWFDAQGVTPHEIGYDELAADPVGTTERALDVLGLEPSEAHQITVRDHRQADELNADWIRRFRADA